jgi:hypothetical protein
MASSKFKGTKYAEPFVGIVRSVFDCPAFSALSPHACKLLLDLAGQYRGDNNGNLTVAWSVVSTRGWKSRTTLWRCKAELINAGFVYVTRKGHMPSTCELLALTWFPLDVSPKFDPEALACFRVKAYRDKTPLPMPTLKLKPDWTQPNGGRAATAKTQALVHLGNIERAASPVQKQYQRLKPIHCFSAGLVGHFFPRFNVPQVDTFIEKPFCSLNIAALSTAY